MKRTNQGQVLLFIILVLGVVGILAGSLAVMWQSEVKSRSFARHRMIAFYLAEAGLERAKIEVLRNVNLTDDGWCPDSGSTECPASAFSGYRELDTDLTDNFTFYYHFRVIDNGAQKRILQGWGEVQDSNGKVLSKKTVEVGIDGVRDAPPADGIDDDDAANLDSGEPWREL